MSDKRTKEGEPCLSLGFRFRFQRALHWPDVRHRCANPYCPEKVCITCGKQVWDCIEEQKEESRDRH